MLALNIEDDTLKLTVFKGKRIKLASEIPMMPGWVQNGVVVDRLAVGQQIIKTLLENRVNDRDAVACVSATHSIYRVVYVPKLERSLMAEAARKEMERVSPVPLDTLYTSWQDVKMSEVEFGLCLLGLPHDNVDSVVDTMTLAGLKLRSLELKPLSVARVIDELTSIVVNIQLNGFDITILENGIPELIRSLTFPQAGMLDTERASVVKEELARTVNFHNTGHAERQLGSNTACFISGQMQAGMLQDAGYIVKSLPEFFNYPGWVDTGRFAANTGLMLKDSGGKSRLMKVEINAMPRAVTTVKAAPARPSTTPLIALIIGVLIIIAAFILSSSASGEVGDLQTLVIQQQKQVSDLQTNVTQQNTQGASQLDQYRQTLNSLKAPLDYLAQQRAYSNRDLGIVTSNLPAVMYLTSISDDGETLSLEGTAPSNELILNYARDLRQTGSFKNVSIDSMTTQTYSNFKFVIKLTLNR
jgi:Tfp pilus assembly protein PilN